MKGSVGTINGSGNLREQSSWDRGQKFKPDGTAHPPGSWFAVADSKNRGVRRINEAHRSKSPDKGYGRVTEDGRKHGGDCFNDPSWPGKQGGTKQPGIAGPRSNGKGDAWFQDGAARHGSKSNARKAASAMIAKIPLPLARHIAAAWATA